MCNKRPKAIVDGEAKKACNRCMSIFYRAKETKAGELIEKINKTLGSYAAADLEMVDEPYRSQLKEADGDIFLHGEIGVGKTFAMSALIKEKILHGHTCERIVFDSFCSQLRSTWGNNSKITEDQLVEKMSDVDCLFIDDIGLRSSQETEFSLITLFRIIADRQTKSLPTYITTNRSLGELASQFDGRIASRLSTSKLIKMTGKDRRMA